MLLSCPTLCRGAVLAMVAGLLAACGPTVMVEQSPVSGLPGNGHYAWGKATDHVPGDDNPRVNNDIIAAKVQAAVNAGLAKRGYALTEPAQAAWLVHYHASLQKQTEQITDYRYPAYPPTPRVVCSPFACNSVYGWGYYGPPETVTRTVTFHEGTLILDIHDARSNKLVWRGTLSDDVDVNKPLDQTQLQKAVDKLLQNLPAANGSH